MGAFLDDGLRVGGFNWPRVLRKEIDLSLGRVINEKGEENAGRHLSQLRLPSLTADHSEGEQLLRLDEQYGWVINITGAAAARQGDVKTLTEQVVDHAEKGLEVVESHLLRVSSHELQTQDVLKNVERAAVLLGEMGVLPEGIEIPKLRLGQELPIELVLGPLAGRVVGELRGAGRWLKMS